VRRARAFVARLARAGATIARDKRIPRPLRWAAGVGALPIPGPFDEALLLIVVSLLFVFYPRQVREAWHASRR
jgi:hypothetical protein